MTELGLNYTEVDITDLHVISYVTKDGRYIGSWEILDLQKDVINKLFAFQRVII